jgi:hypothetical protein
VQSGDVLVAIAGLLGGVHIRDRQGPGHFFKMSRWGMPLTIWVELCLFLSCLPGLQCPVILALSCSFGPFLKPWGGLRAVCCGRSLYTQPGSPFIVGAGCLHWWLYKGHMEDSAAQFPLHNQTAQITDFLPTIQCVYVRPIVTGNFL